MKFPPKPKTSYLFPKEQDKVIFDKLSKFEKCKLNAENEKLIKLLYSQLEDDWRTPLEEFTDELLKKYGL